MTTRKRFSALREEHALVKSEQERIAAQLERRDRLTAMGALASGIAHEIRNPLNAISMIVQRFRTEFQPAEDVEEYRQLADTMRSEVQRVNGIVTQFLEFARPPKLDLQPARLADIVRRAADVVDSEARHAGITVALDLQESPAPCLIDVPRMQQALLNLFQNALQSMRSGGTLAVSLRVTHRACILTVRDTGCGIPRETLPNIFNLCFTTKQGGAVRAERRAPDHRGTPRRDRGGEHGRHRHDLHHHAPRLLTQPSRVRASSTLHASSFRHPHAYRTVPHSAHRRRTRAARIARRISAQAILRRHRGRIGHRGPARAARRWTWS
ncbi:MAG: hypothetical protein IPP94_17935 [Ignavibacteria bacterium]|nr:hypothetical protein [Ignavibacteria bacterium]